MMRQAYYLIFGIFFQVKNGFGIDYDETGESRATYGPQLNVDEFYGTINSFEDVGELKDRYGNSEIILTKYSDEGFEFKKRYLNGNVYIKYVFRSIKKGDFRDGFAGYWQSEKDSKVIGLARCHIKGVKFDEYYDMNNIFNAIKDILPPEFFERRQKIITEKVDIFPPDAIKAMEEDYKSNLPDNYKSNPDDDLPF